MKITLNESKPLEKVFDYHCVLKNISGDDFVIFAPKKGENAIVLKGNDIWADGQYYGSFEEDNWELFQGEITISN